MRRDTKCRIHIRVRAHCKSHASIRPDDEPVRQYNVGVAKYLYVVCCCYISIEANRELTNINTHTLYLVICSRK